MLHLAARDIPVPTSVSPEAQAALAMGRLGPPQREYPALDDVAGWKTYVSESDDFVRSMVGDPTAAFAGTIEERDAGSCPLYVRDTRWHARRRPPRVLRHPRRCMGARRR